MKIFYKVTACCLVFCATSISAAETRITNTIASLDTVRLGWNNPESRFIIEQSTTLGDWYSSCDCVASSRGMETNRVEFPMPSNPAAFFRLKSGLEVAEVPDPSLDWVIRLRLGLKIEPTNKLYDVELAGLNEIVYQYGPGIFDLTGMQYCINLKKLEVAGASHDVSNLYTIANLTTLTNLTIASSPNIDTDALGGLTNLNVLHLWTCGIDDNEIINLRLMDKLEVLSLQCNELSDVGTLTNFPKLTQLNLENNAITNLHPLNSLTNLDTLNLGWNSISDISPLSDLRQLSVLNLNSNPLTNIEILAGLSELEKLELYDCQITNIAPLVGLTNLWSLYLGWNQISDTTPLESLQGLTYLNLSSNNLLKNALEPIGSLTNLTMLYLWNNEITNVMPLTGLSNLTQLNLGQNSASNASPLSSLSNLEYLDLSWNGICDINFLVGLTNLQWLHLEQNNITNIHSLITNAQSGGLGTGDTVYISGNPILDTNQIEMLRQDYGVTVEW
jgi:internalin A